MVSLFCYPNTGLPRLLDAWTGSDVPIVCVVPEGIDSANLDRWIGHKAPRAGGRIIRGALTLALPVDIHQVGEFPQIAFLQCRLALRRKVFDEVKIVDHRLVGRFTFVILLLENRRRRTRVTGKEKEKIVFQAEQRVLGDRKWPRLHLVVRQKPETGRRRRTTRATVRRIGAGRSWD